MDKILITGANGFIGKSLVELLDKEQYQIIAINHHDLDLLNLDKIKDFFEENKYFDYVIHTASVGGRHWDIDNARVFYENVTMFDNLILFKDRYKKLITFGSGAEFNKPHMVKEFELNNEVILNYYGSSKKYITNKVRINNLPVIILRVFGCFGKYELDGGFIKSNIIRYKYKLPMIINQNKWMDFIYINDLAMVIDKILKGEIMINITHDRNISYKNKYTLIEISKIINTLSNYEVPIRKYDFVLGSSYNSLSGIDLENLGAIGLEEGIKQLYNEI